MQAVKSQKLFKKCISVFVLCIMLLNILPWRDIKVYAFNPSLYKVDSVTVFKVYDANRNLEQRRVLITGSYLMDATVGIVTSTGYQPLSNRTVNSDGLLQFDIGQDQLGSSILINGFSIPINEGQMPTLTGVNMKVKVGIDNLVLQGTNLTNVANDSTITAQYEHDGAFIDMPKAAFTSDTNVTISKPSGTLGLQNIIFQKQQTIPNQNFNTANPNVSVAVTVKYTYLDQFRFFSDIKVSKLDMHPNVGEAGETVFLEAPNPSADSSVPNPNLSNYDVFFLKKVDGTDPYTVSNKGLNKTFQQNVGGMDILTVQVPDLPLGEYYVVLTNPITAGNDPMKEVVQEMVVNDTFTVIDGKLKSKIISVQPNSGPDTGSKTVISGQFFVSLNVPGFTPNDAAVVIKNAPGEPGTLPKKIEVDYSNGGIYNGTPVTSAVRTISAIIGGEAYFLQDTSGNYLETHNNNLDTITVQTSQVTDAETSPLKDVVIETETTLTKNDGTTIVIKERAALTNGYTYIPSKVTPTITDAAPNIIQVVNDTPPSTKYVIPGDRMLAIHGKNFMITRFNDAQGNPVVRYPVVYLGPEIVLDKNTDPTINVRVFDSTGKELDGTAGSEIGTKILVTIPAGKSVTILGKTYLRVTNPVRNSTNDGLNAYLYDYLDFENPDSGKNPVMTAVTPSVEAIEGGDTIVVDGSNFTNGVKVFIDGEEVKSINRQGDGKKITFICPPGREGDTQLEVMNPEGGMDVWPFTYVKTYTNPKITDFSPKTGKTDTLVIVTGDNFLKPEPTADESSIMKLIGSRIFLEGIEVNEYNLNPTTKKIELKNYASSTPVLSIADAAGGGKTLKIEDFYSGILLQDMVSKHFYTLDVDVKGRVILSNGAGSDYIIQLSTDNSKIVANKVGGNIVDLSVANDKVIIDPSGENIVLNIRTLYKVDQSNNIVGNRVQVMDRTRIYFRVPILEADGYYDVTVMNPDTKKDTKYDQQGFYYFKQPQSMPAIDSIFPNEGSTTGGYTITISGKDYEDNGTTKSRVFINGVEVASQDIVVSTDGKSMVVKVPAYPGDLMLDKGTSRLTVPVVIVNSDGGSASLADGFTYVVPGSHPQITKIVPQKGAASGGDLVEITGMDFRYYEPYEDANRNQVFDPGETFNNLNKSYKNNTTWDDLTNYTSNDPQNDLREPLDLFGNSQYTKYFASPVLPRVFFGKTPAKIVEYSRGYLKVVVPAGVAGNTEVFVINNDAGMSNKVPFTYVASSPKINSILPAEGKKQGRDKVEINGEGFMPSNIDIYTATVSGGVNQLAVRDPKKPFALVRFGTISNRQIPREQENSGRIDNGKTTVQLPGGLTVSYDGVKHTISVSIEDNGTFTGTIQGYDDSVKFIPVSILTDNSKNAYAGYELIRVEVSDRRLYVDRGYSPEADYTNPNQLNILTPSYYTIGVVPAAVINPDSGTATAQFEYKNPASNPMIINITKDSQSPTVEGSNGITYNVLRMNYKGGSVISIIGQDFRENARIQISDVATITPADIKYTLPNKLTFTMPAVPESAVGKLCRVVVLNEDGGSAASDDTNLKMPIYIIFTKGETSPAITKISPDKGPASGGTKVKIEGTDFRESMDGYSGKISVYIGESKVDPNNVTVVDYKTIYVITPAGAPGSVTLRVENPDGEISNPGGKFTYLSTPKVTAVVDPTDATENTRITVISVVGGQEIKLKGSGFMNGARVVFNPVVRKVDDPALATGQVIYIDGLPYVLESGVDGTNTKYIDSETVDVTTPAGKLGTGGVIVINPDGGASEEFEDLTYGLPELSAPSNVKAELVYDRYIKVNWTGVTGAAEYEIYAIADNSGTELVGSTELTSFMYSDLKPKTTYKFIIKAVGDYGASKPSPESNTVKTGSKAGAPDDDGSLTDNTTVQRSGDTANITIGEKDFDDKAITIDLTKEILAGSREVIIGMSAFIVTSKHAKDVTILGKDFRIKFNPNAFTSSRMEANKKKSNAGVRFKIAPYSGDSGVKYNEGTALSTQYVLTADAFVGKDSTPMDYLTSSIEITMDLDIAKAQMRNMQNIGLNHYDGYSGSWTALSYAAAEDTAITAAVYRMGRYLVIGRRN